MNTDQYGGPEDTFKMQWLQTQTLHAETTGDNINKFKQIRTTKIKLY